MPLRRNFAPSRLVANVNDVSTQLVRAYGLASGIAMKQWKTRLVDDCPRHEDHIAPIIQNMTVVQAIGEDLMLLGRSVLHDPTASEASELA